MCKKEKTQSFLICCVQQRGEWAPLFIIRQNALQDTHKGRAEALRGERRSGVSRLSPA